MDQLNDVAIANVLEDGLIHGIFALCNARLARSESKETNRKCSFILFQWEIQWRRRLVSRSTKNTSVLSNISYESISGGELNEVLNVFYSNHLIFLQMLYLLSNLIKFLLLS
ncbi:hypothetical protein Dimus_016408 [Dionaea muscipula]